MGEVQALEEENRALKRELQEIVNKQRAEKAEYESKLAKEKKLLKGSTETMQSKEHELETLRGTMVQLSKQLDEEITRRDTVQAQSLNLERKLQDLLEGGTVGAESPRPKKGKVKQYEKTKDEDKEVSSDQVSTKLMRVIQQWMDSRDCQQAFLRNAGINDVSFNTIVQCLTDCKSLQVLDVGKNFLTMDSCSEICRLITTCPALTVISLAENAFSLRSIGYFMTAVMERQNKKRLVPLEVLDLEGNEGFVAAANSTPPENLMNVVTTALGPRLPPKGAELVAQIMKALWKFLHFTEHPQVAGTSEEEVSFHCMDKSTIRKMENALTKIIIMTEESEGEGSTRSSLHANLALVSLLNKDGDSEDFSSERLAQTQSRMESKALEAAKSDGARLPNIQGSPQLGHSRSDADLGRGSKRPLGSTLSGSLGNSQRMDTTAKPARTELRDPFGDLKAAFEPPKEKLKTFNLKQIVTRNGTVLMNMLERLLETTEIDARDVESEQTLLEYACQTGNIGLAKLCYRRGANLSARTKKGESHFNIVTKKKRYDLMEFLHMYGVNVNHQDVEGRTALHVAAANDDVDAVCRLLEWGADVNLHDFKKRTPLHTAARSGHMKATMLLLEVGADLNAKDEKEYTAVAHAEANNHFALMDRLVALGGKGHGLSTQGNSTLDSKFAKSLGDLTISSSVLKSSPLGRLGKVAVKGLPGPLSPSLLK